MNRAFDETVNSKRAQLVGHKGRVAALSWTQLETAVEICGYCECVGRNGVIVHNVNPNTLSKSHVHDRPWTAVVLAAIESDIQALVSCYDNKIN